MRRSRATFVEILKGWDSVLIQLFMPGLLLNISRSNSVSSEVYYSRVNLFNEVDIFALTKAAPLNITKFWIYCIKNTTII